MKPIKHLITVFLTVLLLPIACSHQNYHHKEASHKNEKIITAETVYNFKQFRPANMTISNNGRVFVTGHPIVNSVLKVVEVFPDGEFNVYPNDEYSNSSRGKSVIGATIGINVDSQDNLWLLDMAKHQFVVWNIQQNQLEQIIKLPKSALVDTSFLQDFVLDEKRNRVIIADMSQNDLKSTPKPAFVVVELQSGKVFRVAQSHPSMMPDFKGGFALNPITIDSDFEYVYFGAMHAKKIYRVKAEHFDKPETLASHIEYYSPKSYSDGIKIDKNRNIYVTDIEQQAIGFSNDKGYKIIAKLPENQTWPDGIFIKNGFVYTIVNQLDRTAALNNGIDETQGGFIIVKNPVAE